MIVLTTIQDIVGQFSDFVDKIIPKSVVPILVQLCATAVIFILVAKFIFKPVRKILKERQDYVESKIKDAEDAKIRALDYEKTAQASIDEAKNKSKEMLIAAENQCATLKAESKAQLEEELKLERLRAAQEIEQEKKLAVEEVRKEIVDVAITASETILNREIDEKDNRRLVEDFVKDVVH